ncbi:MAG: glycosyltransferase, partial [Cyanobacteria bacterium REEB65]|nr:glycosyltransferase [Cyanobacteria bacterium REEB65]
RLGLRRHLPQLATLARQLRAEVLHSHFGDAGWRDAALADVLGIPHVVSFYGLDVSYLPRRHPEWLGRYRELFSTVAAIFCEGTHMARCIEDLGCPPEKVIVHHLGVETHTLPFRPSIRHRHDPLRVLVAGSFREKKGIPDAIAAAARAAAEVPVQLTIVGGAFAEARSRSEQRRIHEAIGSSGLADRIRLTGFLSQAALLTEAARQDVLLAPSVTATDGDTEGGAPMILLDMMAAGLPVVGTRHCDIPEVLAHGRCGLLAPEHDIAALSAHLVRLSHDEPLRLSLAQAARRRVEARYDASEQGRLLADRYGDIVWHRGRPRM